MKVTSFALVAAVGLSVSALQPAMFATAAQTPVKKLVISVRFSPDPPSTKSSNKIVVSVKDALGKPVTGATVRIATSMPTMAMKGADMVARDSGHGTYTADVNLNYATMWAFDITAKAKGQSGTTHVERDLK